MTISSLFRSAFSTQISSMRSLLTASAVPCRSGFASFLGSSTRPMAMPVAAGLLSKSFVNPVARFSSDTTDPSLDYVSRIRNVAVVAHVDHGKTTLVDQLLKFADKRTNNFEERSMDSNELERERGITILSKPTSIVWTPPGETLPYTFNIVDTPGHADFGGEVERVLSMVDGVLLVVDATEGPMAQTKFVLSKALQHPHVRPVVVFNKVDRESSRLGEVENEVFDMFVNLCADDHQLDYPMLYASAREGWVVQNEAEIKNPSRSMQPLLEMLVKNIPPPTIDAAHGPDSPFSMLASIMEGDKYLGRIVTGKIYSGSVKNSDYVKVMNTHGEPLGAPSRVLKMFVRRGLVPEFIESARAGEIISLAGASEARPTHTLCAPSITVPIPSTAIDPPTVSMTFAVNTSPLAGKEGTLLTGTAISDRLYREAEQNVAITLLKAVGDDDLPDAIEVRGRGELQLAVLVETMRREGFELTVSPPRVVYEEKDNGELLEPIEEVTIHVDEEFSSQVIEKMQNRKGELQDYGDHLGKTRLIFRCPTRGLIGFQHEFKTDTKGTGVLTRSFLTYEPYRGKMEQIRKGALVSSADGVVTAYALFLLDDRGIMFVTPQTQVYAGMIIGEYNRDQDLDVNPTRAKKLTNIRAAGSDEAIRLSPPRTVSLEEAIAYLMPDELLEVTPKNVRLRKRFLDPNMRKQEQRKSK